MIKVTKSNDRFITRAIANLLDIKTTEVSYGADRDDNLVVFEGDISNITPTQLEEEIARLSTERELYNLRRERDRRLAETDWWASSDLTITDEQIAYRQALRDITSEYSSLSNVVWPVKP